MILSKVRLALITGVAVIIPTVIWFVWGKLDSQEQRIQELELENVQLETQLGQLRHIQTVTEENCEQQLTNLREQTQVEQQLDESEDPIGDVIDYINRRRLRDSTDN